MVNSRVAYSRGTDRMNPAGLVDVKTMLRNVRESRMKIRKEKYG